MARAMKATRFESFEDGSVTLWGLDENKHPALLVSGIRFQERVVGSVRYYEAELAGHQVEKVIRIPRAIGLRQPLSGCFAVIGMEQYRIARTQNIPATFPPCVDLTLEQNPTLLEFDPSHSGSGGRY